MSVPSPQPTCMSDLGSNLCTHHVRPSLLAALAGETALHGGLLRFRAATIPCSRIIWIAICLDVPPTMVATRSVGLSSIAKVQLGKAFLKINPPPYRFGVFARHTM